MGSRDRKLLSNMVYGFYRLGHAIRNLPVEERILTGLFLGTDVPCELLQYFRPDWNENVTRSPEEKISIYRRSSLDFALPDIFPWKEELSEDVDHPAFCLSFLQQPDLFLRIRPGNQERVLGKLKELQMDFAFLPPFTVRLPNGSRAEEWFAVNKEIVIQDYSSQRTAPFLQIPSSHRSVAVWDACAASGGKSLLAYDLNPSSDLNSSIDLTVSDIRESILRNLRERFQEAGIKKYYSFVTDLSVLSGILKTPTIRESSSAIYDLVIADVPCSGSGTWGRTPEELYFFDKKKIGEYRELQRRIVSNLIPAVRPGGYFVYITCSVFREENEAQVDFILEHSGLKLEKMELLKGYDRRADTLFVARFIVDERSE